MTKETHFLVSHINKGKIKARCIHIHIQITFVPHYQEWGGGVKLLESKHFDNLIEIISHFQDTIGTVERRTKEW